MKNFSQFLKEEVDLKGNKGVPEDFMSKAKQQATKNLGIQPETNRPVGDISSLIARSTYLLTNGLNRDQIEERYKKLEDLAKRVIMEEYGDIIESSEKPVEMIIRLIRPSESVITQLPSLMNVSRNSEERPEYSDEEESDVQSQSSEESQESQDQEEDDFFSFFDDDSDYQDQEEENPEEVEQLTNKDVAMAIDKKKILNMLTQGECKATKDIIKYSDVVEEGIREILGDSYREILNVWSQTSDMAHKYDWSFNDITKSDMMKDAPGGMAGAVDVAWESISNKRYQIHLLNEDTDFTKIVIRAFGIDFPMLIHEAVKGIYMLLQSSAIKKDKELAQEIKRATSSFKDESQDFKYGVPAQAMFRDFINKCKDSQKYHQMRARVFAFLAIDKNRGGAYTDVEFLEITHSLFSCFDSVDQDGKISFKINESRFNESKAKLEIEKIISSIVKAEDEYREELNRWEMEQKFGNKEEDENIDNTESDIDKLVKQSLYGGEEEKEVVKKDYKDMSIAEIQNEIENAVSDENYELASYLTKNFLKGESKSVWERELIYLNESKIIRRK